MICIKNVCCCIFVLFQVNEHKSFWAENEAGNAEKQCVYVSEWTDASKRLWDKQMQSNAGVQNKPFVPIWELCCIKAAAHKFK